MANQTLNQLTKGFTLGSILSVGLMLFFSSYFERGVYEYVVVGAIYEIIWIPTLLALFLLPVAWIYLAIKKKVNYILATVATIVLLGMSSYLIFWM